MSRDSKRWASAASTVLLMGAALPAVSQVAARQGDAKVERPTDFTSPMVLEVPLPDLASLEDGQTVDYGEEISQYFCDDVSILELHLELRRSRQRGEGATVQFRMHGRLHVRPSHDRKVTLRWSLVEGEEVLAEAGIQGVEVEEGKSAGFKKSFTVDEVALADAFSVEPYPILRLTVWVRED